MEYDLATILILLFFGLNSLMVAGLFVFALFQKGGVRHTLFLHAWFILICPVAGPLLLGVGQLVGITIRTKRVNMADVSFSKIREESIQPADSTVEMNYVPLEDAIAFADIVDLRRLLINILKSGDREMLASAARVINNPDTEASHFGATAVLDLLSDFRNSLQMYTDRLRTDPEDVKANVFILEYTYQILRMKVMKEEEQESTIRIEKEIADNLFTHSLWYMKDEYYLWMTDLFLSIQAFDEAEVWVNRAMQYQSDALSTYKARLHFHYARKDSEAFFKCIAELEYSSIPVDKELLDLIRAYSAETSVLSKIQLKESKGV